MQHERQIWIVDFGSQYTQLITRRTRELGFSSEIITVKETQKRIENGRRPHALVLSGGPASVFSDKTNYDFIFKNLAIPVLGICYGMQLIAREMGGEVCRGIVGEYGHATVHLTCEKIFSNFPSSLPASFQVWMSHSDHVIKVPDDFEIILKSHNDLVAAIKHKTKAIMGLQFHPEVEHGQYGKELLEFFYREVAGLKQDWNTASMLEEARAEVSKIKGDAVLCAFSGGVDSLVAATLTHEIIGGELHCFFVDNGLLRPQDYKHIEVLKKETKLNIEIIDAKKYFYDVLRGVRDPEDKRKAIGKTFIEVFEKKVHEYEKNHDIHFTYLLQGTLYPDVIESITPHKDGDGKSVTIKSHHNVGGLPERMKLKLLEPLRYLFKDEVRNLGMALNLKYDWVFRHPFPGPGIGIRILGEVTNEAISAVAQSDQILFEELKNHKLYQNVWQAFTVFLPIKTVGVKGDARAYENVIVLRIVGSSDGMTAVWSELPASFLSVVSARITGEVKGITRVVYDITSKPPGTIEWE